MHKHISGWNDYVKKAHPEAKDAFLLWQSNSKPHDGPICDVYVTLWNKSRARLKYCLRFCRSNENHAKADSLAKRFMNKDVVQFWIDVKKVNNWGGNVVATTVCGVTGEEKIIVM